MEKSEETLSNLEDRNLGMIQVDEERELRLLKSGETFWEISDSHYKSQVRIMGIPEGEMGEEGIAFT